MSSTRWSSTRRVGGSRFELIPDPPEEGRPVEVTYIGPACEVEYQVDDGPPVKVTPDADGKFRIDPVPSGEEIVFSDNRGIPGYLHRCIVSLG